jgi:DUF4097 and DUF4098 domain-containing protein YvlB
MTEVVHKFQTPGGVELDVSVPAGAIDVETVDGEESVVVLEGDARLVDQTTVELNGRRLVVAYRGRRSLGITIAFGDFSFGGSRLRVRASVPHGAEARLTTVSADMRLTGRFDALAAKSTSGDLTLRGEIERDAEVKTVSGDVRLERVGGSLRCQGVSGDVDVAWVGHEVETKSVSGDVRLGSLREGDASFTSVSGDIQIGIAAGSFLDVDAGTVSGDLSSEVPLSNAPEGDGGGGPTVVLRGKTVSGDVKVFRAA